MLQDEPYKSAEGQHSAQFGNNELDLFCVSTPCKVMNELFLKRDVPPYGVGQNVV